MGEMGVMMEISSGKMVKESAVKKCHSDPAMSMRRRGYARQLLRAVHTGKRREGWRGRARTHEPGREKYEGGTGVTKDESGGRKVGGKSGRKSGSEKEGALKIGQPTLETCHRIPLERSTVQRIEAMRQRILSLLDQIWYRLCRISVPDGENDRQRRERRSMEFAVRFSRNYLYDLNRLVTRLRRNAEAIERLKVRYGQYPIARARSSIIEIDLIERELVAAHQLLLHALTAYSNHIPGAALISHTARLTQVLLRLIVDLKQVSDKFQLSDRCAGSGDTNILRPGESDKEFRSKCQAILTKFDEQWTIKGPKAGQASQAAVLLVSDSANNRTTWNRDCCTNRLRMYNGAELAIAKPKPSRKQQHRPPGTLPSYLALLTDINQSSGQRQGEWRGREERLRGYYSSSHDPTGIYRSRGNKRENLLKNKSKCIPASAMISKLQRAGRNVANAPAAKMSYTINQTSLATHRSASEDEEPKKSEFPTMMTTTLVSTDSERAGSTVTEPGLHTSKKKGGTLVQADQTTRHGPWKESALTSTTNASVSTDANSEISPRSYANCGTTLHRLRESSKNTRRFRRSSTSNCGCDTAPTPVTKREQRILCDASCQANSQSDSGKVANYLPPAVNESRTMLILSERTEKCFSEYRCYYQQQCRLRPMYSNSARNKPWDIVSWISDKLVDELLHHVSKELQITSVIRKMFELEFRDS